VNGIIAANLHQDPVRINKCRELLAPIADAWREAANTANNPPATAELA
jgi:flagellin-specific chaperone FliS